MSTVWFIYISVMVAVYAVLDGFDLGIGSMLYALTKSETEREQALEAIGPVWNGNEVWLLAGGGAMVAAFPRLYACSFSGFYLPLIILLWLFVGRGIGYEFRHFEKNPMWRAIADFSFCVSSLLIALIMGVAVGNVLHGVPLDKDGLFTGAFAYLLNPFTLVAGLLTVSILAMHGAAYLSMRVTDELQGRASKVAFSAWVTSAILFVVQFGISFIYRPDFLANYMRWPWMWALVAIAAGGLFSVPLMIRRGNQKGAFYSSVTFIIGTLCAGAAGLYPRMLPSMPGSGVPDLTIYNTAADIHSQATALIANACALVVVIFYMSLIYRKVHQNHTS